MPREITERQREILDSIKKYMEDEGKPPTLKEIGDMFGFAASTIFQHLGALEKKGFIRRGSNSRDVEIVGFSPSEAFKAMKKVPVIGRVAAGHPILAEENIEGYIYVDGTRIRSDDVFALKVKGESMTGAGIFDGDIVIVRKQSAAEHRDTVVALTYDEATVKRFMRKGGRYSLEPANDKYKPIPVRENTQILGKVIGVQRTMEEE
jgi:repressor LexA